MARDPDGNGDALMTAERFMYGDEAALVEEPAPVLTVLLIGWDGRQKLLTGTYDALWREFMTGDGGPFESNPHTNGWEYWVQQTTGTNELVHATVPPSITLHRAKKGS